MTWIIPRHHMRSDRQGLALYGHGLVQPVLCPKHRSQGEEYSVPSTVLWQCFLVHSLGLGKLALLLKSLAKVEERPSINSMSFAELICNDLQVLAKYSFRGYRLAGLEEYLTQSSQ